MIKVVERMARQNSATVKLSVEEYEWLRRKAYWDGSSMAEILRRDEDSYLLASPLDQHPVRAVPDLVDEIREPVPRRRRFDPDHVTLLGPPPIRRCSNPTML